MPISELDVLKASARWLWTRGTWPYFCVSVSTGAGRNKTEDYKEFSRHCEETGISTKQFVQYSNGPDLSAFSPTEFWHIECKGSGLGKPQTQRNNFDRAFSSVVSYFDYKREIGDTEIDQAIREANPKRYLGLGIPNTPDYLRQIKGRVGPQLRSTLNLWLLIYNTESHSIEAISPTENLDSVVGKEST